MNKLSVLILSVIFAVSALGQTPAAPAQAGAQPAQQYVLVPAQQVAQVAQAAPVAAAPATPAPATVPQVAQQAAQAVARVVPGVNAENLGQTFGSTLGGVLQSFSEATGGAVNKTADLTGSVVDKSGDVLSKTADKTGDLAGKALDRTFGKDTTLVQGLENLGNTRVGTFAMVLAGWKVMGKDGLGLLKTVQGILIGVPLQLVLIGVYIWVIRRFFMTRSVILSKSGGLFSKERKVEYGLVNVTRGRYEEKDGGPKVVSTIDEDTKHVGLFLSSAIFILVSILNVAQVIF